MSCTYVWQDAVTLGKCYELCLHNFGLLVLCIHSSGIFFQCEPRKSKTLYYRHTLTILTNGKTPIKFTANPYIHQYILQLFAYVANLTTDGSETIIWHSNTN